MLEVNSFANPFPFVTQTISCLITEFQHLSKNSEAIRKYNLETFPLNILDKRRTLIEKMVSLIRFSFSENPIECLTGKIRHFYDIFYLYGDQECKMYLNLSESGSDLIDLIQHDKETFDEPAGWATKKIQDSPILTDFNGIWQKLKNQYNTELSVLAFSKIPEEEEVEKAFKQVVSLLFYHKK
ncbi:MAG: nucleotidyl transferase AbiEii/AbiGii toxin family protein [Bacteroidetes bacterium]|nr:nucleotidyl transferase AbiEii/AbiGii toxin family protein [Bacteroidota bacterium]